MQNNYFFPPFTSSSWQLDRSAREVELGLEYGSPVLNIDGQTWTFEDGHWVTRKNSDEAFVPLFHLLPDQLLSNSTNNQIIVVLNLESSGNTSELWRKLQRLQKRYKQVKEENNLLKLKYELLMEVVRAEP